MVLNPRTPPPCASTWNPARSFVIQPLPDEWRKKPASGHRGDGSLVPGKIHVYPEMAAAGLWTTPTDLAKFGIEVQLSYAGKSNKVLPKELIDKMVTPFMEDVALGFFIDKRGNSVYNVTTAPKVSADALIPFEHLTAGNIDSGTQD